MRTLIVILVLANLGFAAWALLIDPPPQPPVARDISHLLPLVLASEPLPAATPGVSAASAPAAAPAPVAAVPVPASGPRCVAVGPFGDMVVAAAANALLQARGFAPKQRDDSGSSPVLYWVYIDKVPTDAAAAELLQTLRSSGMPDAHVMPPDAPGDPRRVSVGLFNEHAGAERRAAQVKDLGLAPVIREQRQGQSAYWLDINLAAGQNVSTDGLVPAAAGGAHLEVRDCPTLASSTAPRSGASR